MVEQTADLILDYYRREGVKGQRRSLDNVTVLSAANDPYRVGTARGHVEGQWLADQLDALGIERLHFRGIHYRLIGRTKPDGTLYGNNEKDWVWLQAGPGKAARWLGYIDFDRIIDERNAAPTILIQPTSPPTSTLTAGYALELPNVDDVMPTIKVDFEGRQRYRLAIVGEKSSLATVLRPIAEEFMSDLLLPTGELSDTMIYHLVRAAAEDGRRTVVFYVSDCDPSGWQMAISLARKIQALTDSLFPTASIEIRRVALTPDQVKLENLPSSVLKETEKRAGAWKAAFDVEQTEVDAVPPALMDEWVREAIAPFYDSTLDARVTAAENQWRATAQAALDAEIGVSKLARLHERVTRRLAVIASQWEAINVVAHRITSAATFAPPEYKVPDPQYDAAAIAALDDPLYTTDWSFLKASLRLIKAKAYRS